ncbi:hypothetical protein PROFUN_08645 [Planoprotostelium fungivorum]|uniref:Uncharacterized protein n=1 Tax=Planoprotostelium fungivorum TaxID=1890364 RepID=A0A2P6NJ42_9EUKA|nr:hypothetical protein PROFUN_08645 [Planoprotostelium fungivorum]
MSLAQLRRCQVNNMTMYAVSNLLTIAGGMTMILSTRIFNNGSFFRFGDACLQRIGEELHMDHLKAATVVLAVIQGITWMACVVCLLFIEFKYHMQTVTDAMSLFGQENFLSYMSVTNGFIFIPLRGLFSKGLFLSVS